MLPKLAAITVLKKGLERLKKSVATKKADIKTRLRKTEKVSEAEEEWLDHGGNTVDAERVIDILDEASDYERAVATKLDDGQREIVKELKELCGIETYTNNHEEDKKNAQKQKRMACCYFIGICILT